MEREHMPSSLDALNRFCLPDYPARRPFASFLPGIAGPLGIPLWAFYVNRGQGIAAFGVQSKDHPLMEYQPAQRAYQTTPLLGFRTFLRVQREGQTWLHEPFSPWRAEGAQRDMFIGLNELEIEERHARLGLQVNVLYFTLPGEPFAALVRRVTFRNTAASPLTLEVVDGLPALLPFGVDDAALKHMGRTLEAWMEVVHHAERLPFYRLKASPGDSLHVHTFEAGHFALAALHGELLPALVDPAALFGADTSLIFPQALATSPLTTILQAEQVTQGRTPCAFFAASLEIPAGEQREIVSLYGHMPSWTMLTEQTPRLLASDMLNTKLDEARRLALDLTEAVSTRSASPLFDAYCRQTFLDNVLRGGYPVILGGKHVCYLYSRRHGDLERDYNHFVLPTEFYSQGDGNYRDVNQNRRNDVFFVPQAGEYNIRLFMSLIQADGYNPLVVQGSTFTLPPQAIASLARLAAAPQVLEPTLRGHFTPGQLLAVAQRAQLTLPLQDFLEQVFAQAQPHFHAAHGEGYWIDHWTYNLDLIEAFLAVFPEKREWLLFDAPPLPFYDNAVRLRPRAERFVLDAGRPRQLNPLVYDEEKAARIAARTQDAHWARCRQGRGEVFRLPLFSKLALLALIKFATLDPAGMGIQMEAGRPGWCDALNGLPALFGSSMAETYELLRLVEFLTRALTDFPRTVVLPREAAGLLRAIRTVLRQNLPPFAAWERLSEALEAYRAATRLGFDGATRRETLTDILAGMKERLQDGIARAEASMGGLPPTYFVHTARAWEETGQRDDQGRPLIRVTAFEVTPLPLFLEGAVRRLKTLEQEQARTLYLRLRASDLFDRKLGMYRLNASLQDWPHEIGRARAFPPGWLENESIWLHMTFKYLLELLRAGLYEEFFSDLQATLPPFLDPAIYGRSPLENSSFIVSSAHPDPTLHGAGFVARLSGSTAEFLSMWVHMTAGPQPFRLHDGALILALRPLLPGWLFDASGQFTFRFLNHCRVTCHNPTRADTFRKTPSRFLLHLAGGDTVTIEGEYIPAPYAAQVREGKIPALEVFL
jgi:hypothetical protein